MTAEAIRNEITEQLRRIEQEEQVRILYACESGSRAWGFPSQDSDYDVRFIYVRRPEWYLSIREGRDVIERPISDQLDISGWDLRKALGLYRKSNPPLLEWLQSPIRYAEPYRTADRLRALSAQAFSPKASMFHYLHMARGNFRTYLQGEQVKIKKYFYVLRPILACEWISQFGEMPPMGFNELVERLLPRDGELWHEVRQLLERKKSGEELDYELRQEAIHAYIDEQLPSLEERAHSLKAADTPIDEQLDRVFIEALQEVWGLVLP
ncbi:nucleotidyltransferase domain-containing protein [Paenibacillus sp. PR3]|uniref:Nucleotidyltransferase domain-containing protein n=1 Tax=Paenibacillus terricola TaxID=2763503 RepID=A0ABR8N4F2_9BACL|nr:nucleotidyltransferase domain-containing protein [Paenibacillus terricola]MBD3921334.1 nucleotidyltransferase domain-containing protein [Paenibacillus terricola]